MKCLIKDCNNLFNDVEFRGTICLPCARSATSGWRKQQVLSLEPTLIDRQCFERGCACTHYGVDLDVVEVVGRNELLEEVAKKIEVMNHGDTSASFAAFVRGMKR
jgi:hypothetical protein